MRPQATPALPRPSPSDPAQASPQPTEVLAGSIERVTFHNAENGFCVLRIKARGHRDLVLVVVPLALHVAVTELQLLPVLLPLAALGITALVRRG